MEGKTIIVRVLKGDPANDVEVGYYEATLEDPGNGDGMLYAVVNIGNETTLELRVVVDEEKANA